MVKNKKSALQMLKFPLALHQKPLAVTLGLVDLTCPV